MALGSPCSPPHMVGCLVVDNGDILLFIGVDFRGLSVFELEITKRL